MSNTIQLSSFLKTTSFGSVTELPLSAIGRDPDQPRTVFDQEKLAELAEAISQRGVKTPISVRESGEPGKYIINHGERRWRASELAGKTTIPAHIDNDYTDDDQVVENLHRENLTNREIAEFIGKKLRQGFKQTEIAKKIQKSPAYVSQYVTLLNLPEPIAEAFTTGRTNDVTLINELVKIHKKDPAAVASWLKPETQDISRSSVAALKEFVATPRSGASTTAFRDPASKKSMALRKPVIAISMGKGEGILLHTKPPTKSGCIWIQIGDTEQEVAANKVQITEIYEH